MRRTRQPEPTCEAIQSIVRLQDTAENKERLFIEIGLSQLEARLLANVNAINAPQTQNNAQVVESIADTNESTQNAENAQILADLLARYSIGIEVECFAPRADLIANASAQGLNMQSEDYNHEDHTDNVFKLVTDGSVCGMANPVECVTPVLTYGEAENSLTKLANAFYLANARVNKSCGLHVHVGAVDLSDEAYINTFINYARLEPIIDSFLPESRRNAYYAQHIAPYLGGLINSNTKTDVACLFSSRYHTVNTKSYNRHGTIEFRQHSGTVEFKKIFNWVSFCVKLVEFSKTHRYDNETRPTMIDEIEFLNESEKAYFKRRQRKFARINAAAA